MKNTVLFVALATLLFSFASCRDDEKGWRKMYGYTANDIDGTYSYSNAEDAFEDLTEGEFCILCDDADISITATSDNSIRFVMKSEEEDYYKIYTGVAPLNSHDFMIDIKGNTQNMSSMSYVIYFLNSRVYTNEEGQVRLEGNSAHHRFQINEHTIYDEYHVPVGVYYDTTLASVKRYYFDVIKN